MSAEARRTESRTGRRQFIDRTQHEEILKQIPILNAAENSNQQIADILHIGLAIVNKFIRELKASGITLKDNRLLNADPLNEDERKKEVLRLYNDGKNQRQIAKILKVAQNTISADYVALREQGHGLFKGGIRPEDQRWPGIIKRTRDELPFFAKKGIKPTLRLMFYHLFSLGVLHNTHNEYVTFSEETAIARRGYDWNKNTEQWEKCTKYIKLPIDCFLDESRWTLGDYDDGEPEPPEDQEDYIDNAIQALKDAPDDYDTEGEPPGRWYNQDHYVEVWIEKQTLGPTFETFLKDKEVKVVPNKGNSSVTFLYENCNRLKGYIENGKKVVILYFGDFDPSGVAMDIQIQREFVLWGLDIEFKRVAVIREQLDEYPDLPSDPDKETEFKLNGGIDPKTGKHKQPDPRTKGFIEEYGQLYSTELEAFLAYYPDEFKEMVQNAVDDVEYWDEDVYDTANKEWGEQSIENPEEVKATMIEKITEAFKPGWENE